ncbi:MAG: hypothetical protein C3F11_00270 [Methylocystaceae bacterium]|nr:MAG: hypothetical protein C3F11_00270 [Methylocystaceae bacterium]
MEELNPQADGSVLVDGAISVHTLNSIMGWDLPEQKAATVAGLVIYEAGAIPYIGQTFVFYGYRFEIKRRSANRITSLKVTPRKLANFVGFASAWRRAPMVSAENQSVESGASSRSVFHGEGPGTTFRESDDTADAPRQTVVGVLRRRGASD